MKKVQNFEAIGRQGEMATGKGNRGEQANEGARRPAFLPPRSGLVQWSIRQITVGLGFPV